MPRRLKLLLWTRNLSPVNKINYTPSRLGHCASGCVYACECVCYCGCVRVCRERCLFSTHYPHHLSSVLRPTFSPSIGPRTPSSAFRWTFFFSTDSQKLPPPPPPRELLIQGVYNLDRLLGDSAVGRVGRLRRRPPPTAAHPSSSAPPSQPPSPLTFAAPPNTKRKSIHACTYISIKKTGGKNDGKIKIKINRSPRRHNTPIISLHYIHKHTAHTTLHSHTQVRTHTHVHEYTIIYAHIHEYRHTRALRSATRAPPVWLHGVYIRVSAIQCQRVLYRGRSDYHGCFSSPLPHSPLGVGGRCRW